MDPVFQNTEQAFNSLPQVTQPAVPGPVRTGNRLCHLVKQTQKLPKLLPKVQSAFSLEVILGKGGFGGGGMNLKLDSQTLNQWRTLIDVYLCYSLKVVQIQRQPKTTKSAQIGTNPLPKERENVQHIENADSPNLWTADTLSRVMFSVRRSQPEHHPLIMCKVKAFYSSSMQQNKTRLFTSSFFLHLPLLHI